MFEPVTKFAHELVAETEKSRWTWRRFVRTSLLIVPAYLTILVHGVEDIWSKHYDDEATRTPSRRQARLWACTWGVFHFAALCIVWLFAREAAQLYARGPLTGMSAPVMTQYLLYFGTRGWMFLPLAPLISSGLYRLRLRGGRHAWFAEVANGLVFVALVFLGSAISFGAAVPWIIWQAEYVPIEYPN